MMMNLLTEREAEHHSMARRQLSRVTHIWGPNRLLASLNIAPLDGELPINDSIPEVDTMDEESTVTRIPERFALNKTERAAMARPSKQSVQVIKDDHNGLWSFANNHQLTHQLQRGEREGDHC
jgi:hypothetical protein